MIRCSALQQRPREFGPECADFTYFDEAETLFAKLQMVHGPAFDLLVQTLDQVSSRHAPRGVDRFLDLGQEGLDASL
jgi:hypothetical protein